MNSLSESDDLDLELVSSEYDKFANNDLRNTQITENFVITEYSGEICLFRPEYFQDMENYIDSGIITGTINSSKTIVICNEISAPYFEKYGGECRVLKCSRGVFLKILDRYYGLYSLFLAEYLRIFIYPRCSAFIFSSYLTRLSIFCFFSLAQILIFYFGFLGFMICVLQFLNLVFKIIVSAKAIFDPIAQETVELGDDNDLPVYSILVPLYREAGKIGSIIRALEALDYPKDKLDIKLIVEFDDTQTLKAIKLQSLPSYYHLVVVPNGYPQTKPRACNYASKYIMGEYLVVYDAEDKPEKSQLKKSVAQFKKLDKSYICLQSRLQISSKNSSLLVQFFKQEYDIWFGVILYGMTKLGLPIGLGGTSNHFKVDALRKLGFWDPYNVTEDAEIGMRISLAGYKAYMLDSYTIEDGHISLSSWISQRSRWIKGFMITLISYIRMEKKDQSIFHITSNIIFLGISSVGFLLFPISLFSICMYGTRYHETIVFIANSLLYLALSWGLSYFCMKRSKSEISFFDRVIIFLFPAYFILHSIAAFIALFEMLFAPFFWKKTDHDMF
ncbi:MAG: glycosyltransferase [Rickettsiaceae bacterium]|nr:glycosyltransferase [Rickettsiaceae bacterium]